MEPREGVDGGADSVELMEEVVMDSSLREVSWEFEVWRRERW